MHGNVWQIKMLKYNPFYCLPKINNFDTNKKENNENEYEEMCL